MSPSALWGSLQGRSRGRSKTLLCAGSPPAVLQVSVPRPTAGQGHHNRSHQYPLYANAVLVKNHSFHKNGWYQWHIRSRHQVEKAKQSTLLLVRGITWLRVKWTPDFSCSSLQSLNLLPTWPFPLQKSTLAFFKIHILRSWHPIYIRFELIIVNQFSTFKSNNTYNYLAFQFHVLKSQNKTQHWNHPNHHP